MFHSKPHMILMLSRELLIAHTNKDEQAKLEFPTSVVNNLEVIDATKLVELVGNFADRYGLRGRKLVLVLDDTIVFQKVVALTSRVDATTAQAEFQEKMPLTKTDQRVLSLKLKDQLVLLGANGSYYLLVVQALLNRGVKVLSVAPLAMFAKGVSKLTPEIVDRVVHNHRLASVANFLNLEHKK